MTGRGLDVEVFAGSGGMAEGFRRAGITFGLAFDADPVACESYLQNLGQRPIQMDLGDLLKVYRAGGSLGPIRLLVADPPCTPWSRAGKRLGVEDPRDQLRQTTELIRLARPRAYLIGNIPGLDDSTHWPQLQGALRPLRSEGYCIADYASLDAADFGVPQHRWRPFWFGHLAGPCLWWPLPTHGDPETQLHALPGLELRPWVTCRQALQHLPLEKLGRPVRLKRNAADCHAASEPDKPAWTIPASMPGNGGGVLAARDRHPTSSPGAPSRTLRAGSGRAGRREGVLELTEVDGHPPSEADAPARVVTATQSAKQRVSGVLLVNPRHAPAAPAPTLCAKNRHQGAQVLALEAAEPDGGKRSGRPSTKGPQGKRIGDPGDPGDTVTAKAGRVGAGSSHVLSWPWDRPSTTVVAGVDKIAAAGEHQGHHGPNAVVLSLVAARILQGLPEEWVLAGKTKKAQWSQVGQLMPPPVAEAVARSVREQLEASTPSHEVPMAERPKVPRRPMTHEERVLALHLGQLRYGSGSWFARLARDMAAEAGADEPTITDRQAAQMQRQAWTYRKQLADKGLERLVPASEPPPPEPRPPQEPAPRTARSSRRARDRQAKYDRLKQGSW